MNILKIADGVTGLFPKKITVTLVDDLSGDIIGVYKMTQEHLPSVFNRPTLLAFGEREWRVVKAGPLYAQKRLVLSVQQEEHFRTHNTRSLTPTIAWPMPKVVEGCIEGPVLIIKPEEWRQIEFLPAEMLAVVEEEMKEVEKIVEEAREDGLLGYERVWVRKRIGDGMLSIPFDEFWELVEGKERGAIQLEGNGIIESGFFICSANYTYYGIVENNRIIQLSLPAFTGIDEEFNNANINYDLLLVNWYTGELLQS